MPSGDHNRHNARPTDLQPKLLLILDLFSSLCCTTARRAHDAQELLTSSAMGVAQREKLRLVQASGEMGNAAAMFQLAKQAQGALGRRAVNEIEHRATLRVGARVKVLLSQRSRVTKLHCSASCSSRTHPFHPSI